MQDNPSPSALAIRRATRVRELMRENRAALNVVYTWAVRNGAHRDAFSTKWTKEQIIDEILHLEGLAMAVLS